MPNANANETELAPARALLTPMWVAALAVLVANDHWLKGAGLLPEVVTGKLSDFAGLIVAPVLLAAMLGVRTRRGLLLSNIAVAAVFTGIQLSIGFAAQWSGWMGMLGHSWVITSDPTDLLALPMLWIGWTVLVPAMDPSQPALVPIRQTATAGLGVFGLWATVATSDQTIDGNDEWYFDVWGDVYVNNTNEFAVSLHIRKLRGDVEIDCHEVSSDPGRLLPESAFGEAEHWDLPARTNVAIDFQDAPCGAAWVAGEGIPPRIVFVTETQFSEQSFPGQSFSESELGGYGVGIVFTDEVGGEWVGAQNLLFTPKLDVPELPANCEPPSGESRLDWSEVPNRKVEILGVSPGVDGCYELMVQELEVFGGLVEPQDQPYPFYLCAPEQAVSMVAGERLSMVELAGTVGDRELAVTLLEFDTLLTAVDGNGTPVRHVRYLRGGNDPQWIGPAINQTLYTVPQSSCPWSIDTTCATVERPASLAVNAGPFLESGVAVEFVDESASLLRTAMTTYVRERAVVNRSCSEGATQLSYDIDFVVIETPLI